MMLMEENQVPEAALPVAALRRHLRLGSGFAEGDVQDEVLSSFLRAALAAIEGRTGKALIRRNFIWTLHRWRDPDGALFPLAPVTDVAQIFLSDRNGIAEELEASRYRLEADAHAPVLRPMSAALPQIRDGGKVEIRFTAGFAESFDEVPADLAQAVLLLAAHYYEYRDETSLGQGCMPFGVTALIARYRPLRVGFGA
ncbi:conserved hypothetical protein [Citreicella sp. SE45]|uniref:Phage gp6-like head-tail connector protein n=1 Tax=Salipiger thiooxidans TaxID=282683 RepID=A0A1G7IBT9_9RHOB|nr:head-tail connector protein [Salipiger thiooxidans]EEX14180.1 conserved hypothetical protein [Citreicella sp. SE45]SDF09964.1 phage conserved hypothetical protein, phiE125 gp8 family [Salipiger thiooxidans]